MAAAWFFLYLLAPARRICDGRWRELHTTKALWEEAQKGIGRLLWSHDDGFIVAKYGDDRVAMISTHATLGARSERAVLARPGLVLVNHGSIVATGSHALEIDTGSDAVSP